MTTLDTLAGTAHRLVDAAQWQQVYERLSASDIHGLDALLTTNEETQESPFAVMCRGAGKPTRENLNGLIAHYQWLETLVDPAPLLAPIPEAKVAQWANEAQRLKARELREYMAPRRYALLLAALRSARGRLLDDLTVMLLKFSGKIVGRSEQHLKETRTDLTDQTDTLIATLAQLLKVIGGPSPPTDKVNRLEAIIAKHGGCAALQKACEENSKHSRNHWQPFAHAAFAPYRTELLLLGRVLPLKAAWDSATVLLKAVLNVALEPSTCDYYDIIDLDRGFIPPEWRALVGDRGADKPRLFNRRHLEVVAILELTEAIKAGAVNVSGSASYDDFWGCLPENVNDPTLMAAYADERGWPAGGAGFANQLGLSRDGREAFGSLHRRRLHRRGYDQSA